MLSEQLTELDSLKIVGRMLGFEPDEKQKSVLMSGAKRGILNCCRQWGKSSIVAALALLRGLQRAETLVVVVSPGGRQSGEFLRKVKTFAWRLGLKPRGDGGPDPSVVLSNGSRLVGLPERESTTRGFSGASLLIVDEAAYVEEAFFDAMVPVLATTDGDLWLMSTPNGRQGFFYSAWEYAPEEEWFRVKVTAPECGHISKVFLERERKRCGERVFRQEYLAEFVEVEDALIPSGVVEGAFQGIDGRRPMMAGMAPGQPAYCLGLDLGKRVDHSALAVVEAQKVVTGVNRVTYEYEQEKRLTVRELVELPTGLSYSEVARRVAERVEVWSRASANAGGYGSAPGRCELVVDATGVGDAALELLLEEVRYGFGGAGGIGNWLGSRGGPAQPARCLVVPVVITGGETVGTGEGRYHVPKRDLMSALEVALSEEDLRIGDVAAAGAEVLKKQLRDLRVTVQGGSRRAKFGASGKNHDDLALALALACWRIRIWR